MSCKSVPSTATTTAVSIPSPTLTVGTATVAPITTAMPTREWNYTVVYQDGGFAIREAFLSHGEYVNWNTFVMPPARIKDSVIDFRDQAFLPENSCRIEWKATGRCSQFFEVVKSNKQKDKYKIECNFPFGWGTCLLFKNDKFVWSGHMNGGTADHIQSIKQVGDEIAISYTDSDYDGQSISWGKDLILLTNKDTASIVEGAIAADEVLGKLIFFSNKEKSIALVFDGKDVGNKYDSVFNRSCCWDGPPIQIKGNGEIIDFIARKGNDWYHVQAGNLNYLSTLK
jgi:hypothetical protein